MPQEENSATLLRISTAGALKQVDCADFSLSSTGKTPGSYTTFATFVSEDEDGIAHKVLRLDLHLERVERDGLSLGILKEKLDRTRKELVREALKTAVTKHLSNSTTKSDRARVRIVLRASGCIELFVDQYRRIWPRGEAISLRSVPAQRPSPSIKTTQLGVPSAAFDKAQSEGYHEALLIGKNGNVCEGSRSNIFWFDRTSTLFTPRTNVLPGVTRIIIGELIPYQERDITLQTLLDEASEIFVSQSTTGITRAAKIDDYSLEDKSEFPSTILLIQRYQEYLATHLEEIVTI